MAVASSALASATQKGEGETEGGGAVGIARSLLKAEPQHLAVFENNEDVHNHAGGEYDLEQLQSGVEPEVVAEDLLSKYLVDTTKDRVLAYRFYRGQRGGYLDHREAGAASLGVALRAGIC